MNFVQTDSSISRPKFSLQFCGKDWFSRQFLLLCLIPLSACNLTRHLEPDQYLIKSYPTIKHEQKIGLSQLEGAVDVKPNRRVLFAKFALSSYNLGRTLEKRLYPDDPPIQPGKDSLGLVKGTIRNLKYRIGEPPNLLDTFLVRQDIRRLTNVCLSYGHFHPQVGYQLDTVGFPIKKKVKITYLVREGIPYRIRRKTLAILDSTRDTQLLRSQYRLTNMHGQLKKDTSLLIAGTPYSHELFERERIRATRTIQLGGFYTFTPSMIQFVVDSNLAINKRIDSLPLDKQQAKFVDVTIQLLRTPPHNYIKEIYFEILGPNTKQPTATLRDLHGPSLTQTERDSLDLSYQRLDSSTRVHFRVDTSLIDRLNFNFLSKRIYPQLDKPYNYRLEEQTRMALRELGMFQYLLIRHEPVSNDQKQLRMTIEARLVPQYQLRTGFEVFTTDVVSLLPNAGVTASIRNRNALKRSEQLEATLSASLGVLNQAAPNNDSTGTPSSTANPLLYLQVGLDTRMTFKEFLFVKPFFWVLDESIKQTLARFSPTSTISASFLYKNFFDDYSQLIPTAQLTYQWQHVPYKQKQISRFTPLSMGYIDPNLGADNPISIALNDENSLVTKDFQRDITGQRLSSAIQYSFTNQDKFSNSNFSYTIAFATGGHFTYLMDRLTDTSTTDQTVTFGLENLFDDLGYGQFARLSLEGKYGITFRSGAEWVFHGRMGVAGPMLNTSFVPRERRFYAGGVNGLRGWPSNTLGPGRTSIGDFGINPDSINNYVAVVSSGGDYLFELNAEYRRDLFSYFELALFTDIGNVWLSRKSATAFLPDNESQNKATFRGNQLALGWDMGIGLRIDWDYVIVRLDFGQQIYNPSTGWSLRRIENNLRFVGNPVNVSFGINYPF